MQKVLVNDSRYKRKTKEKPEDREESIFFHHVDNNTPEWQEKKVELWKYANPDFYPEELVDPESMDSSFSSSPGMRPFGGYYDNSDSWNFSDSSNGGTSAICSEI